MDYLFDVGDFVKYTEDGKEHQGKILYRNEYYWGNGYSIKPSRSPRSLVVIVKESALSLVASEYKPTVVTAEEFMDVESGFGNKPSHKE